MSERMKFKTRGLKKEFTMPFTNDVVHRSIKLCPLTKILMSTPQMQRLKQLKQLGVSDILYTCTTHNRFQHSLGVMTLAEQLLRGIRERQPKLEISEKDVVCVKVAGLLHDIGHGPYSHVYDGIFRKQLKVAEERGEWLGQRIDTSLYSDLPEAMEGWAHEDASLLMIDDMLKEVGLEIDEDNLDGPLKQIGDGIDAKCFGIWDRTLEVGDVIVNNYEDSDDDDDTVDDDGDDDDADATPLPANLVLTSRDWIFIKECISGGPLPPKGTSINNFKESSNSNKDSGNAVQLVGRPNPHKEFLYDVVSNRHSGLDVDKMDYLARDILQAHAANICDLLPKLSEKAFVCWGDCSDRASCWKCRQEGGDSNGGGKEKCVGVDRKGMHMMM
mmetsp:Transcript_20516/g.44461  ORF Transcript_20516/g.44461 Transcript_20516/m.44461 type:complete len:386 (-) Transcript_20516:1486-2643(-)